MKKNAIYTADEAQRMWCPFSRAVKFGVTPSVAAYNRVVSYVVEPVLTVTLEEDEAPDKDKAEVADMIKTVLEPSPASCRCIASKCLAWRWQTTHINNPEGGDMVESADTYGYCGLAGKP